MAEQFDNTVLFNTLLEKVKYKKLPFSDENLESLLGLVNPGQHKTYYLGIGKFNEIHFDYLLSLWENEAIIGVKSQKPSEEIEYTFTHISLDSKGKLSELIGIYSSIISKKDEKFKGKLGSIILENRYSENANFILRGMLFDALGAKSDVSLN